MADISFPSSPTLGQRITIGGKTWRWNGYAWDSIIDLSSVGSNAIVQTVPPSDTDTVSAGTMYFYLNGNTLTWYVRLASGYVELGTKTIVPDEVIDPDAMLLGLNSTWPNYWSQGPVFANMMYSAAYPTAPIDGTVGVMSNYDRGSWVSSDPNAEYKIMLTARAYLHPAGDYTILNPEGLQVQIVFNSGTPNPANWSTATSITWNFPGSANTEGDEFINLFVKGSLTRVNGNLAVILPDHLAYWNTGNVWAQSYLNFHTGLGIKVIRAMDLTAASNNYETNWSERSLADRINYHNEWSVAGAQAYPPYEVLCDLAARLNCDLWLCVPHRATDDYIANLATVLAANKPAGHKIYIELGNEVWNTSGAYNNGTAWLEFYDYTRQKFNYDPATNICTLTGHGFSDGMPLRCFGDISSAKQNAGYGGDGGIYLLDRGTIYVKVIDANTFRCFREVGLINEIPAPWNTVAPFDIIFINPNEAGKSTRMDGAYGQRSKEIWDILDPVVGRTSLVHVIASQGVSSARAAARVADPAVKSDTDFVAIAPYFNGAWVAGKLNITSGTIEVNWWSNYAHDVYIYVVPQGTTISQSDVITSGTKYNYATNGASWRVADTVTGLTDDTQYDVHAVFSFLGVDTHLSKTVTVSVTGGTEYIFDDPVKKSQRDIVDSFQNKATWVANNVASVSPVPVICYEGGLEDYSSPPADFEAAVNTVTGKSSGDWIADIYQETASFATAMSAHLQHAALYGAKSYSYYSSARLGCFSIANDFSDVADLRYVAFKNFNGFINPVSSIFSGSVIAAPDIESAPGSFPYTVLTFPDVDATYAIIGGNADNRFTVTGNLLQYVDGSGVDYNSAELQTLFVLGSKNSQAETAAIKFQLGYSWYASDAFFAWDAISDTDVSKLTPHIGKATDNNLNTVLSSNTGGWRDFPSTVKYSNEFAPKPTKIYITKDIFVAITVKGLSGLKNYANILRQNEGTSTSFYIAKDSANANLKLSIESASKTIPLSTFSADPHVVWMVLRGGEYLTTGYDQTSLSAVQTSAPLTGLVDSTTFLGTSNASQNGFQAGAIQVVVRDSITDIEAKAMVAKMQTLHSIA